MGCLTQEGEHDSGVTGQELAARVNGPPQRALSGSPGHEACSGLGLAAADGRVCDGAGVLCPHQGCVPPKSKS